ncbi:MAG: hypothetical protein GY751_18165, partial [Bacteroidetes bacterium]|nr:hypothetical protein [Bacteroidota bacterium]
MLNKLIENQTAAFRGLTSVHILENYEFGPSDVIVRFAKDKIQAIKNEHLLQEKMIVDVRIRLLANVLAEAYDRNPDKFQDLDLILPVCFSDTSDTPLRPIPCLAFSKTAFSNNILIPSVNSLMGYWEIEDVMAYDKPMHLKEDKMCFVGSFTGRSDTDDSIRNNQRVQIALRSLDNPNYFCKIIRPPKVEPSEFANLMNKTEEACGQNLDTLIANDEQRTTIAE